MACSGNLNDYKLCCELLGHSMDVRAVTEGKNCIISGSRDKTVKIWKSQNGSYVENVTLANHSNFVSCVYYMEDEGWICTGSNDATVCVYKEGDLAPFMILKGHESTVCAITSGFGRKILLTGSWDTTARVWYFTESDITTVKILKEHEGAVWAVAIISGNQYATGSADKNIYIWDSEGKKINTLQGHTDCVRGLIGLPDGSLISCSNDACIRYWNEKGTCIRELYGHSNYIYSIALNKSLGDDILVSGSEDSTIRMWSLKAGSLGDSLKLPAQSVWSVACLRNGDIVTGTSDGVVRVFTKDPARFAKTDELKSYNLAVQSRLLEEDQKLGGVKRTELPGPESLLQPGENGQTKIVRHPDGKVNCYEWSNNEWTFIGEVTGASGGTQSSSGKVLYEGKEYDFVFSVDISDSEAPIKLPYNRGEDPWLVAQNFIHKNNLPQAYLDQVANFIMKNSDSIAANQTISSYQDPFTGGSRYIPTLNSNNFVPGGNADPFTGESSYSTTTNENIKLKNQNKHFPCCAVLAFDSCDSSKVLDKLKDFNKKAAEYNQNVTEDNLKVVIKMTQKDIDNDKLAIEILKNILKWPKDILFPVLDITRLAIRNEAIYNRLNSSNDFIDILLENLQSSIANQLMSLRGLANLMIHSSGQADVLLKLQTITEKINDIQQGSSNLQIAIGALYFNLTITQIELTDSRICNIIAEGVIKFLKWCTDFEASYRALQSLGNLSCTPFAANMKMQITSADHIIEKIQKFASAKLFGCEKLSECAEELLLNF